MAGSFLFCFLFTSAICFGGIQLQSVIRDTRKLSGVLTNVSLWVWHAKRLRFMPESLPLGMSFSRVLTRLNSAKTSHDNAITLSVRGYSNHGRRCRTGGVFNPTEPRRTSTLVSLAVDAVDGG